MEIILGSEEEECQQIIFILFKTKVIIDQRTRVVKNFSYSNLGSLSNSIKFNPYNEFKSYLVVFLDTT